MKRPKLYYLGKPDDGFGWGVANTNLVRELMILCDVVVETSDRFRFDAPAFVPIVDHSLRPLRKIKAPRLLGYCFTEWPLTDDAERNSRQYDVVFAGSTWNVEKLKAAGIKHCEPLIQGVDLERFKPQPPSQRAGFVVFSGGKYEFRKGQDYVAAAMRQFMKYRADVVLMTAWHNQWEQSRLSMNNSWLIDPAKPLADLPPDRVIELPAVPNEKLPGLYAQAHIGLFPNRCEAGTNMVMAEFMACERPVIASLSHGHRDVLPASDFNLTSGSYDPAGWFNCEVSDIMAKLEHAYSFRHELAERGRACRASIERFTWYDCARKIFNAAFSEQASDRAIQLPARESQSPLAQAQA